MLSVLVAAWFVTGCDADLSPCARTEATSDGSPRVTLWVDCRDEQAAQLVAVRVTPQEPIVDAGRETSDAEAAPSDAVGDAWRAQSPIEDGTDYFYVEYGLAPGGWDTLVTPRALVSGQRYDVEFVGSDIGSLSFDFEAP